MILYNQIGGKVVSAQFSQFCLDILWIWVLTFIFGDLITVDIEEMERCLF